MFTKRPILKLAFLLLLLSFASTGFSMGQWDWLNDTPVSKFNDDDWALLKTTGTELLDHGQDGEFGEWRNEKTGNHGTIKIVESGEHEGHPCRRVSFYNAAPDYGLSGRSVQTLCKQSDGVWKFVHVKK